MALVVGLLGVNFLPVLKMKVENAKINAIVAEATKKPIPTLKNGLIEDKKARDEDDQAITDYETEIVNIEDQFDALTADLLPADVKKFQDDIEEMKDELEAQKADLKIVDQNIELKEVEIKRAEAIWKLTMVIGGANAKFSARLQGDGTIETRMDYETEQQVRFHVTVFKQA